MATEPTDLPDEDEAVVVPIEDLGDGENMTFDEWLALIADDEPVFLPKPAAAYLEEAREAGET